MKTPILQLSQVEKHFGGVVAINSLSFDLHCGEVLGLIGPNGAGKSTMFNIISGEFRPEHGEILYKGKKITGLQPHKACHLGISRTYQIPQPFTNMTTSENVMLEGIFGGKLNRHDAMIKSEKLLDLVGLSEKKDVPAGELPVLSLKKLELARALASDPELILLDEIAAGTTEEEIPRILEILGEIRKLGKTVIMVEHIMKIIMGVVDRIVVMDKGAKIADGIPSEVMEDQKVIAAYFG